MTSRNLALDFGAGLRCIEFTITYKDLTAAATSQAIPLFTLPSRGKIMGVNVKTNTAFAGTGWTAATVSIGKSGAATAFTSAYDLTATVSNTNIQETSLFKSTTEADVGVIATFTTTGGNVNAGTAGSVTIRIVYFVISTPAS
jgi:hypothetical protein